MHDITPIGITNFRNTNQPFGIKDADRFGHIYCIGKTGVGKSTLLLNMAIADIQQGKGIALIDPHGDISEQILQYIPQERINDVIYFNAGDAEYPVGFNPLHSIAPEHHHLAASGLISTFKKIWADSWGPRLEYILRFSLLSLLYYPSATLLDIQRLLTDYSFRGTVLQHVTNPAILSFWYTEFDKYSSALKTEAISPILNKTGVFISSTILRNIVGQKESSFTMQDVMDSGKILICNLSKGKIGEDASALLGSMLVTPIQLAALQRAAIPEAERRPFYLYVDEMHSFVSLSFADILSEARKYKLSLFLTHQYIEQLHETIRSAIFGNVGTLIAFRVGAEDAKQLVQEFQPVFDEEDLINLPRYSIYIKLMIDGASSKPFSAITISVNKAQENLDKHIIEISRRKYGNNSNTATVDNEHLMQQSQRPTLFP